MAHVIELERSLVPACDMDTVEHLTFMMDVITAKHLELADREPLTEYIRAYKLGVFMTADNSMGSIVRTIKDRQPDAKVIYDHQKAATDVPFTGAKFAAWLRRCGFDAAILFPRHRDPEVQEAWTKAVQAEGIDVIIGGHLTHKKDPNDTEYIAGAIQIYSDAAKQGIIDFVMPGTLPDRTREYVRIVKEILMKSGEIPHVYSPGLVSQGGRISEAAEAAGDCFHGISGRKCYDPAGKDDLAQITAVELYESIEAQVNDLKASMGK